MTRFIDVSTLSQLVSEVGVTNFISGMTQAVREDFMRWEDFDKSPRSAAHSDVGVIELMPVADTRQYAFKYVNGHPGNTALGMSTVMAFGALAEVNTGYPLLLSELTLTTAFRTAATSTMAAKALARPDASVMALIGCGAQSEFQALAFHDQLGINTVRIFDVDRAAMQKLARNLAPFRNLKVELMDSTRDAVRGAHIVTTATADKAWATIVTGDMIEPGMHINGIGGDCPGKTELAADVLHAGKVFVEYEPQTRVEGDIQQLAADHPVHDLWRVLTGEIEGRDSDDQITVFDSVGFALEDFSALRYLYDLAVTHELGETIELVPELADPKDLFRLTLDGKPSARISRVA
ncbi:MAG: ornithine cyclodeaminase [Gammaproteobacteria bacterium]